MSYSSGQQARRAREREEREGAHLPYKRVGICCGVRCVGNARLRGKPDVVLYRVRMEARYRCRRCFLFETGYYP